MKRYTLFFGVALLLGCADASGKEPWKKLIDAPTEDNFSFATQQLLSCDSEWYYLKYSQEFDWLFHMVSEGNEHALKTSMIALECLRAFSSMRSPAFGFFYEKKPVVFFDIINGEKISNRRLEIMLTSMPWEMLHDVPWQIMTLKKRLNILLSIEDHISSGIYNYLIYMFNVDITAAFARLYEKSPVVFFDIISDEKMSNYELAKILRHTVNNYWAVFTLRKRLNILLSVADYVSPETHKYLIDKLISRINYYNDVYRGLPER